MMLTVMMVMLMLMIETHDTGADVTVDSLGRTQGSTSATATFLLNPAQRFRYIQILVVYTEIMLELAFLTILEI